ncbi:MAG: hypothetical protein ACHQXK_03355 [Methanosarcina thermophila]|jgi:hypothetical protein|uniref:Uncharacterized protein n=1 Tax=Methanosarcina thermophila TaxID=2210 RepID=A0A1I6X1M1_METTE|nr:hypothetical protein [Methanosarcina thermophila]NLU56583.1 hypothetical protein [Methanosarcina thermophila]SFT32119.1 hypothetical protein SAMN02910340_00049 [Methanosarcina thermophila]HOA67573.1 hypothetical protein [Methanosarcina thermophila]HOQ64717.1 hypothetical protein [Methanosarcina thermophila]HPT79949.1 hypothetical protein [Methanosarcina thermophila]
MRADEKFKEIENVLSHRAYTELVLSPDFTHYKILQELSANSALLLADTACPLL